MNESNYWFRAQRKAMSRRTVLRGAVVGGLGLTVGAACGGGDDGGSANLEEAPTASAAKQEEVKSFLWQRTDTTAQAQKGGILGSYYVGDVTLDPLSATSYSSNYQTCYVYPTLVTFKSGHRFTAATGELQPGLAESWQQPDATTVIFKLQPKAKWDPKLDRAIDADDVVFSWKKFAAKGQTRVDLANSASSYAPIISAEAVDKSTVKFTLAFPMAATLGQLAYDRNLLVMPRESEGPSVPNGFDPLKETRSGGPWILESYQRSVGFSYRRNPNFWDADKVWLDGFDQPIIAETAVRLAQFRAKKIWWMAVPQTEVIGLHNDMSDMLVDKNDFGKDCWQIDFGYRPGSPFRDDRVRRALSMLIDRDQYLDTWNNVSKLKAAGFPMELRYNAHLSDGWKESGYYVDPKSPDMGAGGANFTFNPAEAKKLLDASGLKLPIETEIAWIPEAYYGTDFPKWAETFKGFFEAQGYFKLKTVNPPYATEYLPKYYWNKADFEGIAVAATTVYPADPDGHIFAYYHSKGAREKVAYKGTDQFDDGTSDRLIEAQRKELDPKKRMETIKEWQRYAATKMPTIPFPGHATTFGMTWPWVGNYNVFPGWDWESDHFNHARQVWFDKSKYTG